MYSICMYVFKYVCNIIYVYIWYKLCAHVKYACTHACNHALSMCVCMYVCMYVGIYMYVFIFVCISYRSETVYLVVFLFGEIDQRLLPEIFGSLQCFPQSL